MKININPILIIAIAFISLLFISGTKAVTDKWQCDSQTGKNCRLLSTTLKFPPRSEPEKYKQDCINGKNLVKTVYPTSVYLSLKGIEFLPTGFNVFFKTQRGGELKKEVWRKEITGDTYYRTTDPVTTSEEQFKNTDCSAMPEQSLFGEPANITPDENNGDTNKDMQELQAEETRPTAPTEEDPVDNYPSDNTDDDQEEIITEFECPAQSTNTISSRDVTINPGRHQEDGHIPMVIMYHDIVCDDPEGSSITRDQLESHLKYLKQKGFTTISANDLYNHYSDKQRYPLSNKSVLLTFDDGYLGTAHYGVAMLRKYNMKAVFFIHTKYVGVETETTDHANWDEWGRIDNDPLFEVFSHTATHPYLTKLSGSQMDDELRESKKALEKHLGGSRTFIAYPFGDYDKDVITGLKRNGYLMGFAITDRIATSHPFFEIPRVQIQNNYGPLDDFITLLNTYLK